MSRSLGWAFGVNLAFVVVEFIAGTLARSLALITDAVHNLTDLPSMSLSLFALYAQRRPADPRRTYGYQRSGVLAAFVNALVLVAVALYIFYEAYERLQAPVAVRTSVLVWVSLLGIGVNGGIAWAMWRGRRDLNLRAVLIHNAGDAASNAAILAGALVMARTGWYGLDAVLSFAIGAAILWSSAGIIRETTNILLEGTPRGLDVETVARAMLKVPGVLEVHDIHIWSLAAHLHALSCHVRVSEMSTRESEKILEQLNALLAHDFNISHTTIQFEPEATVVAVHEFGPAKGPNRQS
ncbi:MAG: cation transporter [Acidobacteria bacterium]|nr:cation transporter [Acidobacteriota bacterium]